MAQISIITPVRNGLPWIEDCVRSVLAQEFSDWELLISDNQSSDATRDYLSTLSDPRIRVFYQNQNLGIPGNLNFLIRHASAPLCQFLCHDDFLVGNDALSRILQFWKVAGSDVGFIRVNWNSREARNALERFGVRHLPHRVEPQDADLFFFIFGCIPGNISNVSMRTELRATIGGFNHRFPSVGDFEFWTRAARQSAFLLKPDEVVYVRAHAGQASKYLNQRGESIAQLYDVVETLFLRLRDRLPPWMLQLHATISYDALQRWIGVRQLIARFDRTYLRQLRLEVSRAALLRPHLRWIPFVVSGGGRWGLALSARALMARQRQ